MKAVYKTLLCIALSGLIFTVSCNKEPDYYILQGQVVDGTAHKVCTGLKLYARFDIEHKVFGNQDDWENSDLGSVITDSNGHFFYRYEKIKRDGQLIIKVDRGQVLLETKQSPNPYLNKNSDIRLYNSTLGTLRLQLNTNSPLANSDTLFVAFEIPVNMQFYYAIDTFLNLPSNYHIDYIKSPVYRQNIYWGRSANNLVIIYDPNYDTYRVIKKQAQIESKIEGDPVINEVVINY